MSLHDKTLKLVTNLDRAAVEARLAEVRKAAQAAKLSEVANSLAGIEGLPRAEMETRLKAAMKPVMGKPEHNAILAQLELVELNLPNLK
jgi:hypothetical protein